MSRRLALSMLVLLMLTQPGHAQIVVVDPTNLVQNSITAIESVLTTIQTVILDAQGVLNLTSVGRTVEIAEDMRLLGQIVEQAEGLSYDVESLRVQINALFNLDLAPADREGLTARLRELKLLKQQTYSYAARVQTLLKTAIRTIDHLNALLDSVSDLVGNLAGQQTHIQNTTLLNKHLTNLDVQTAAFYRAQTVDKLSEAIILESIRKIQLQRLEDWPSY